MKKEEIWKNTKQKEKYIRKEIYELENKKWKDDYDRRLLEFMKKSLIKVAEIPDIFSVVGWIATKKSLAFI